MKIIVDTNVILDALTSREPWKEDAETIFRLVALDTVEAYITASSATDIYYLLNKYISGSKETKTVMEKLYSLFGVLDVTGADCLGALMSPISDYEDALMEQVARNNNVDYIVTRNDSDFICGQTKVITPKEFVGKFI